MTFEFLIACRMTADTDIKQTLTELLTGILADREGSFNEGILAEMVRIRHQRPVAGESGNTGTNANAALIGFSVELPDDTRDAEDVIMGFADILPETPPIFHVVKFEDPLLEVYLVERASEIFALEMKLRRVLSFVYMNAYQLEDPLNLLREERRENQPQPIPEPEHMIAVKENQFFYLVFSQYVNLNQRHEPRSIHDLLESIRSSQEYDSFRAKIMLSPIIEDEDDVGFIASLRGILTQIEGMRNCVAHNRRPSRSIRDNYPNAREQLEAKLNEYLTRWEADVAP